MMAIELVEQCLKQYSAMCPIVATVAVAAEVDDTSCCEPQLFHKKAVWQSLFAWFAYSNKDLESIEAVAAAVVVVAAVAAGC